MLIKKDYNAVVSSGPGDYSNALTPIGGLKNWASILKTSQHSLRAHHGRNSTGSLIGRASVSVLDEFLSKFHCSKTAATTWQLAVIASGARCLQRGPFSQADAFVHAFHAKRHALTARVPRTQPLARQ